MTRNSWPFLIAVGILWGTCAWAQNDTGVSDSSAPTQLGPKPAFTYPDTTPSLDFLNGALENSSISLGVGAGVSYLSNGYRSSNSGNNQGSWLFHVAPNIRIQQFRPKLSWYVAYSGGLQTYTYSSSQSNSLFYQSASGGFLWQFARHWQMQGSNHFTHSANPFDSYLTHPGTPTQNNPNPVTYTPLSSFTQNTAFLTLSNQLTKVDTLTFTGTTSLRNTSTYNLVNSVPFYNLISYGGLASYTHRLSPRLTLGGSYDYNSLDFGHGQQRSGIQTIEFIADYLIRPNMSISGWIGPEYTSTKTVVGIPILSQIIYVTNHHSLWSTALGANFGWRSRRNSFRAGFRRQVSDGGGITATSEVNSVNVSYGRLFTTKMSSEVGMRYYDVGSITTSKRNFQNIAFNARLTYKLAKSLTADAQYSYIHQIQSSAFLIGSRTFADNIIGVSINYTWTHPLGR